MVLIEALESVRLARERLTGYKGVMPRARAKKSEPRPQQLTAIIEREGDGYVALCPELDIASQGDSVEEARGNLVEAVELFFETAHPSEVRRRLRAEVYVTRLDITLG